LSNETFEMLAQTVIVGVVPESGNQAEDSDHVLGYHRIDLPQIGEIKAAIPARIPPCEKEICDATALASVALCDFQKPVNRIEITRNVRHAATIYAGARLIAGLERGRTRDISKSLFVDCRNLSPITWAACIRHVDERPGGLAPSSPPNLGYTVAGGFMERV
jgi:hypothetical protein